MRITELDFDAFAEDHHPNMHLIRERAGCRIWSAGVEQNLLVLMDSSSQRSALFEYDTVDERYKDIQLVLNLPDDGTIGGVAAIIGPIPPHRTASAAKALPMGEDEDSIG